MAWTGYVQQGGYLREDGREAYIPPGYPPGYGREVHIPPWYPPGHGREAYTQVYTSFSLF